MGISTFSVRLSPITALGVVALVVALFSEPATRDLAAQDSHEIEPPRFVSRSRLRANEESDPRHDASSSTRLTMMEEIPPRPRAEVDRVVKSIAGNDARINVVLGQGRLLTLRSDLATPGQPAPLIAVGDPTIVDFQVIDARHIRMMGQRIGVTDLAIVTSDQESYSFEISVGIDLSLLEAQLEQSFPEAQVRISQLREHVVLEGQARDTRQVTQIVTLVSSFLESVQSGKSLSAESALLPDRGRGTPGSSPEAPNNQNPDQGTPSDLGNSVGKPDFEATLIPSQIINLIRVPGPQQVMLKVKIAELNRTALRRMGTGWLLQDGNSVVGVSTGTGLPLNGGSTIGGGSGGNLLDLITPGSNASTMFGVFDGGKTAIVLDALRQNQVLNILAEPTLVAMNGQEAQFRAGGEFPVPVPQPGGGQSLVTIQFKEFGVSLVFKPFILDDETIRLSVVPEVSSIDYSTGVVFNGTSVPGTQVRSASTVVEMPQGQTLAIAGILQVQMDGSTRRVPGLGDLPYLGALFSNNTNQKAEKELIVLVTPYLIDPMHPEQVTPTAGELIQDPNDKEFYLKGRIESRDRKPYRATASWDDPVGVSRLRKVPGSEGRARLSLHR